MGRPRHAAAGWYSLSLSLWLSLACTRVGFIQVSLLLRPGRRRGKTHPQSCLKLPRSSQYHPLPCCNDSLGVRCGVFSWILFSLFLRQLQGAERVIRRRGGPRRAAPPVSRRGKERGAISEQPFRNDENEGAEMGTLPWHNSEAKISNTHSLDRVSDRGRPIPVRLLPSFECLHWLGVLIRGRQPGSNKPVGWSLAWYAGSCQTFEGTIDGSRRPQRSGSPSASKPGRAFMMS